MSQSLTQSPFQQGLGKRFLDEDDSRLPLSEISKRARQQPAPTCSPSGFRCCPETQAYAVGHNTVVALRALFPDMNDKVIADVLAEYGNNIDAAIKHLNDLRLSAAQAEQDSAAAAAARAAAEPAQQQQQQQQQIHQQQQQGAAAREPPGTGEPPRAQQPKSAAEWVDLVVQQMAEASSVEDAKQRAASILQAFEQAAVQHAKGGGGDAERLKLQAQELAKENQLLKRAVAIQNARLQELGGKEAEAAQLRTMLESYQQKVHALEVQNYSLALHLKQATDSRDTLQGHKNPDVF